MIIRSAGALLCATMLLLLPARAEAQTAPAIVGGFLIPAIAILVINSSGATVVSGRTDAKGTFTIPQLPKGKYELRVGAIPANAMSPNRTVVVTISVGGEQILAKTATTRTFTSESSREIVIFAPLPHPITSYPFPVGSSIGTSPRNVTITVQSVPPALSPL